MDPKIPPKYRPRGISFLYEDRDVIVVSKEAGILTTHTRRHEPFTVENAVGDYLRKGCARSAKRAFLVHRLDRETSGLLLFAKNEEAQERWKENEKIYFALLRGTPSPSQGVLESYLAENEDLYMVTVRDSSQGKFCQTEYEVLEGAGKVSAVRIRLLTGRKNQIRAQFAHAGHPVLGDEKYGRDSGERRLYLHAAYLAFNHPFTGRRLAFESPVPRSFTLRLGRRDMVWPVPSMDVANGGQKA